MSQINNSPTIDQFKKLSQGMGSITQDAENNIIRGPRGTWFRSLCNVGDARQKNIETITSLKNAINQDEKYKFVAGDILARLGTMSTKLPLSCSKVRAIINKLDKNVKTTTAINNKIFDSYIMKEISSGKLKGQLSTAEQIALANEIDKTGNKELKLEDSQFKKIFTEQFKENFISAIKRELSLEYKDKVLPPDEEKISSFIQEKIKDAYTIFLDINRSTSNEEIANTLYALCITDNKIPSPQEMHEKIIDEVNKNTIREKTSYDTIKWLFEEGFSTIDAKNLKQAFFTELKKREVNEKDVVNRATNIYCSVQEKIRQEIATIYTDKERFITKDEITKIIDKVKKEYINLFTELTADQSQTEGSLKFWFDIVSTTKPFPSMGYITALNIAANSIDLQSLPDDVSAHKNSITLLQYFRDLSIKLLPANESKHIENKEEYIEHITGLCISNQQFATQQLEDLYSMLTEGAGKALYNTLNGATQTDPINLNAFRVLHSMISYIGNALGKDPEKTAAALQPTQDKVAIEPEDVPIVPIISPAEHQNRVREKMIHEIDKQVVSKVLNAALSRSIEKEDNSDIIHHSNITIDGTQVQSFIDTKQATETEYLAANTSIFNKYAAFISGDSTKTLKTSDNSLKFQVSILMGLLNKKIPIFLQEMLTKNISLVHSNGSKNHINPNYAAREENISLTNDEHGNIHCFITVNLPIKSLNDNGNTIELDDKQSYHSFSLKLIISREELTAMGNKDLRNEMQKGVLLSELQDRNHENSFYINFNAFEIDSVLVLKKIMQEQSQGIPQEQEVFSSYDHLHSIKDENVTVEDDLEEQEVSQQDQNITVEDATQEQEVFSSHDRLHSIKVEKVTVEDDTKEQEVQQ